MPPTDASPPVGPAPRPRRRWLRLSLRGLMLLVLLVGGGLGWVAHSARVQREAVAAIIQAGGSVDYDWQAAGRPAPSGVPRWLVDALGADCFGSVVGVQVAGSADDVMAAVGRLPRLKSFRDRSGRVTDAGLAHLAGLDDLEVAVLGHNSAVTGRGLAHLAGLGRLRTLDIGGRKIGDNDLAAIGRLRSLRDLSLSLPSITDAGLMHLGNLTALRTLNLTGAPVTGAGLAHLQGLVDLHRLDLSGTRVADLAALAGPSGPGPANLETLVLTGSAITDAGLAPLLDFPKLNSVFLTETAITDAGVATLARFPALEWLSLMDTSVADVALDHLDGAPRLNVLMLKGAAATPTRVAQFGRDHPQVKLFPP